MKFYQGGALRSSFPSSQAEEWWLLRQTGAVLTAAVLTQGSSPLTPSRQTQGSVPGFQICIHLASVWDPEHIFTNCSSVLAQPAPGRSPVLSHHHRSPRSITELSCSCCTPQEGQPTAAWFLSRNYFQEFFPLCHSWKEGASRPAPLWTLSESALGGEPSRLRTPPLLPQDNAREEELLWATWHTPGKMFSFKDI